MGGRHTDGELIQQTRAGSRDAAEELFSRYWPRAWRVAVALSGGRPEAEDVLQEAFGRAYAGLSRFNGRSSFPTWLLRIVVNCAIDECRRERRRRDAVRLAEPPSEVVHSSPDPEVAAAVTRLAPERRVIIVLRYWLGYSAEEIASVLDLPPGTVHSRLSRALAELRSRLEVDRED
jgi:RNA polymerase sigma-70 factor (ECF subfamily)